MGVFGFFKKKDNKIAVNFKLEFLQKLISLTQILNERIDNVILSLNPVIKDGEMNSREISDLQNVFLDISNTWNKLSSAYLFILNTTRDKEKDPWNNYFKNIDVFKKVDGAYLKIKELSFRKNLGFSAQVGAIAHNQQQGRILEQEIIRKKDKLKLSLEILRQAEMIYLKHLKEEELEKKFQSPKAA